MPDFSAELAQLPDYEKKLGSLRETVKLLLTPEREARQKQLEELEKSERDMNGKIAVLVDRKNSFEQKAKPLREALAHAAEDVKAAQA